jgi:hypothetical protein
LKSWILNLTSLCTGRIPGSLCSLSIIIKQEREPRTKIVPLFPIFLSDFNP